ncbi:MAG TPA: hypothetical protein PKD07_07395 [Microthrixaceae bacterium]|nr:hypothetical protein [Microthrixaceae bacterium]
MSPPRRHGRRRTPEGAALPQWLSALRLAAAWWIGAIGPAQRLGWVRSDTAARVMIALVGAALVPVFARTTRPRIAAAVVGGGAAIGAAALLGSPQVAVMALVGVSMGWFVLARRGAWRCDGAAVALLVIVAGLGMWWGRMQFGWRVPTATMSAQAAVAAVALRWPEVFARVRATGRRALLACALALASVGRAVVRLAGSRRGAGRRMLAEHPAAVVAATALVGVLVGVLAARGDSEFPNRGADTTSPPSTGRAAGVAGETGSGPSPSSGSIDPLPPAAMRDSPWFSGYQAEVAYMFTRLDAFRQVGFAKLRDGQSSYINISAGQRRTWRAPECSCRRRTVWLYGSATAFGLGQRDDHTIASELARVAWEHGVAIDVVNRAVPGDQVWLQADRFAWDVTLERPDAVIFLTGVSDLNAAIWLDDHRSIDRNWPLDVIAEGFMSDELVASAIRRALDGGGSAHAGGGRVRVAAPLVVPHRTPVEVGALAARRMAKSLPMSVDAAAAAGVPGLWVVEPMRLGRPPVTGEPTLEGDDRTRAAIAAMRRRLPPGPLDLVDLFDGVSEALYYDDVHYNEAGARVVAERLFPEVLSRLGGS